ncbi:Impact family [Cordyceps fumosorosea ARSEF 2679]|uniref:Impact family n=1 Tax=Cordyceps fumosorosea (strain ARSEF 2679) TaxID=1081104 RepID=A0A168BT29_CORFA|nr:Impact family [Cordyceps fumosorosea ARSEF 2679]OAA70513.1 Impact family [Cordyceps fumosorosea ARSEF 2679]
MASQGDLQELLRMFTARKVPMLAAMGHVKSLQAKNLKSIEQIADAPLKVVEEALKDAKLAKGFHTACKSHTKKPSAAVKRRVEEATSPSPKKAKLEPTKRDLDYSSMAADDLEASLELPLVEDEALIRDTTIVTNRAPLVLAFAVELLRVTMPEQPPSSRLSLAQALVSANSRSKAVSIGIEQPGREALIAEGQPKVRVMGREIPVLKRGDYTWSGAPAKKSDSTDSTGTGGASMSTSQQDKTKKTWTASATLTSRASTFVAHAASVSNAAARPALIRQLMAERPDLETASHNAWAIRTSFGNSPLVQQASFDDGETGCGKLMLEVMREADITNTLVVLTRWFGGVMLGPDRWRLMRECVNDALASRGRVVAAGSATFNPSEAAVWGLDAQDGSTATSTVGMGIHRPEGARNYLLRSFASPAGAGAGEVGAAGAVHKKTTVAATNDEKQENLGRLLGALRIVVESWSGVLTRDELDKRAWNWYVAVRLDVQSGPSGWGARGELKLRKILDLKRNVG